MRLLTEARMTYKFATETLIDRAQQSRTMAAHAPDARIAAIHQTIADTYDKLAADRISDPKVRAVNDRLEAERF